MMISLLVTLVLLSLQQQQLQAVPFVTRDDDFATESNWKYVLQDEFKTEEFPADRKVEITELYNKKTPNKAETKGTVTSQTATCTHTNDDIDIKQYTSKVHRGGTGGTLKYINKDGEKQGRIVRSIRAWKDHAKLHRLEVELSDGSHHTCGYARGVPSKTLYLSSDERINHMYIYSNESCDRSSRVTGISFGTNKGQYFSHIARYVGSYQVPSGSGILVGFQGQCGHHIDTLGVLLLQKVQSSILSNIAYPDINSLIVSYRAIRIDSVTYDNSKATLTQEYTLSGDKAIQETSSWSIATPLEAQYRAETKIRAGLLLVNDTGVTRSVEQTLSYIHDRELAINYTRSYAFKVRVPPKLKITATATIEQCYIDTRYIGTVNFTLVSGNSFSYPVSGRYTGIASSKVMVTAKEIV